jgi:hypothetical protein
MFRSLPLQHGRRFPLLVAATVLLVAPGAAEATAWSPPRDLTPPFAQVSAPKIAFWPGGEALVSWRALPAGARWQDALEPSRWTTHLGVLTGDGAFQEREAVRAELVTPVTYGRDRLAVLRQRGPAGGGSGRRRLAVSFGSSRRPPRVTHAVATYEPVPDVRGEVRSSIAVSRTGEVAVAWAEQRSDEPETERIRVAVGTAGRGFARPLTLAAGRWRTATDSVKVAFGARNELLAVYTTARGVEARVRVRPDTRFSPPTVLGPRHALAAIAIAQFRDGRQVVAWGTRDYGEAVDSRFEVWVATQRRSGRFRPAQRLDRGPRAQGGATTIGLTVGADSSATVAWSAIVTTNPDTRSMRVGTGTATGAFAPYVDVARGSGYDVGDVVSLGTATLLLWGRPGGPFVPGAGGGGPGSELLASISNTGAPGPWQTEAISGIETWSTLYESAAPDCAIDPRSGRAVVVWASARTGGDPLVRLDDSAVVRVSQQ